MFEDRRATFRSYQTVREIALKARERGGVTGLKNFNVVDYIDGYLAPGLGSRFELVLFSVTEGAPKAFVTFNNKTDTIKLSVSKLIWNQGKFNIPDARFVLAHELGHIFMHKHDSLAFSSTSLSILSTLQEEDRAEPQANLFADTFLVYDDLVQGYTSAQMIEEDFRVPAGCAKRRFSFVDDERRRNFKGEPLGDLCPRCFNASLVRDKTVTKCKLCSFEASS